MRAAERVATAAAADELVRSNGEPPGGANVLATQGAGARAPLACCAPGLLRWQPYTRVIMDTDSVSTNPASTSIYVIVLCTIHSGRIDDFKAAIGRIFDKVRGNEPGTQALACYLNEDETVAVVREVYDDSDAVLAHLANIGAALGELMATCTMSITVLGDVSPALRAAAAALQPSIFTEHLRV